MNFKEKLKSLKLNRQNLKIKLLKKHIYNLYQHNYPEVNKPKQKWRKLNNKTKKVRKMKVNYLYHYLLHLSSIY